MIVPEITKVSSNVGSTHGQDINIDGLGFGTDNVEVTAGGLPCHIKSV